jgi:hypothetical protein
LTNIDEVLHDFIDDKIAEIKSDPTLLEQIFEGRSVEKIENIKLYLSNNDIRTVYHFPRDATELPCYAIILDNSSESEQVIGSSGDIYDEVYISGMEDGWISSDSDILRTNQYLPVDVKQFYSSVEVKDGRRCCRMVGEKTSSLGKGIFIDFQNSVLEGGYVSLVDKGVVDFWIKSNRIGTFLEFGFGEKAHREQVFNFPVTARNLWEKIRIDINKVTNRNKDKVRYMSFVIVNASQNIDVFIDTLKGEKSSFNIYEESYFDNRYRIESWTNNADLTLIMHDIIKWNLLKYRTYLENSWGFMEQRIDGGDIVPQPEYYPEFAYIRSLGYNCKTIELVPREYELTALEVKLGRQDWGVSVSTDSV